MSVDAIAFTLYSVLLVIFLHEQVSDGVAEKLRSTKDGLNKLQDDTINVSKVLVVSLDNLLSFINFSSYDTGIDLDFWTFYACSVSHLLNYLVSIFPG